MIHREAEEGDKPLIECLSGTVHASAMSPESDQTSAALVRQHDLDSQQEDTHQECGRRDPKTNSQSRSHSGCNILFEGEGGWWTTLKLAGKIGRWTRVYPDRV